MSAPEGKSINVSLRVIADLSQGLYRSPADAIKELVSNAYDADSPSVEINFSNDCDTLTIRDLGSGMSIEQFVTVMETIGGSSKRSADNIKEETPFGRKIVGRIGIGLLSVSQIANKLEIQSTIKGSDKGFKAYIEFDQFASEEARKIKITELWEDNSQITLGKYFINESSNIDKDVHFTTLTLSGIKRIIAEKLRAESEIDGWPRMLGRELHTVKELVNWMRENGVTKTALHEYDRLFWELCLLCPVPYFEDAFEIFQNIKETSHTKDIKEFVKSINKDTHFKLFFDGHECFKPLLMPHSYDKGYPLFFNLLFMNGLNNRTIKFMDYDAEGSLVEKELKIRGYIYFQRPKVVPPELQGILIRVRNVAVGHYDSTFLTYRRHEGFKFSQITGEIYIDNLDLALHINRSSFRETEPAYVAFRDAIHNYLSKVVFPAIKEYATYERGNRAEENYNYEKDSLAENFALIDNQKRKVLMAGDQDKLIIREKNTIKIATSIDGKKLKFNKEIFRIIAFMEAKLGSEHSERQLDNLYEELTNWLN